MRVTCRPLEIDFARSLGAIEDTDNEHTRKNKQDLSLITPVALNAARDCKIMGEVPPTVSNSQL